MTTELFINVRCMSVPKREFQNYDKTASIISRASLMLSLTQEYKNILISAFNCKNSLISDEWRAFVLNFHNDRRRSLARGQVASVPGKVAPPATKMNELVSSLYGTLYTIDDSLAHGKTYS